MKGFFIDDYKFATKLEEKHKIRLIFKRENNFPRDHYEGSAAYLNTVQESSNAEFGSIKEENSDEDTIHGLQIRKDEKVYQFSKKWYDEFSKRYETRAALYEFLINDLLFIQSEIFFNLTDATVQLRTFDFFDDENTYKTTVANYVQSLELKKLHILKTKFLEIESAQWNKVASDNTIQQLQQQLANLNYSGVEYQNTVSQKANSLWEQYNNLHKAYEVLASNYTNLHAAWEQLQLNNSQLATENGELKENLNQYHAFNSDLFNENQSLKVKIENKENCKELEEENKLFQFEITQLETALSNYTDFGGEKPVLLKSCKEKLPTGNQKLSKVTEKIKTICNDYGGSIQENVNTIEKIREYLEDLCFELNKVTSDQVDEDNLSSKVIEYIKHFQTEQKKLKDENEEYKKSAETLNQFLGKYNAVKTSNDSGIQDLKRNLTVQNDKLGKTKTFINNLIGEYESESKVLNESLQVLLDATQTTVQRKNFSNALKDYIQNLTNQIDTLKDSMKRMPQQNDLAALRIQNNDLTKSLNTLKTKIEEATDKKVKSEDVNELSTEIEKFIKNMKNQITTLQSSKTALETRLGMSKEVAQALRNKILVKQEKADDLKKEITETFEGLEGVIKEISDKMNGLEEDKKSILDVLKEDGKISVDENQETSQNVKTIKNFFEQTNANLEKLKKDLESAKKAPVSVAPVVSASAPATTWNSDLQKLLTVDTSTHPGLSELVSALNLADGT